MDNELTCWIELPGRRVSVAISVHEEPEIPAPHERERRRLPLVNEWAEICGKLAKLEIAKIQTRRVPLLP